jgi:hypothetical protein
MAPVRRTGKAIASFDAGRFFRIRQRVPESKSERAGFLAIEAAIFGLVALKKL